MSRENFINFKQMNQIGKIEKSYSYTIPDGPHKGETLWSGRYCAVSCVVLAKENNKWYVLINKRGKGTPDDQGKWNMPCGYLDGGESATEACSREVAEECGVNIPSEAFALINVETDPKKCNKGIYVSQDLENILVNFKKVEKRMKLMELNGCLQRKFLIITGHLIISQLF